MLQFHGWIHCENVGVYFQFETIACQQSIHIWCLSLNQGLILNTEALYGLKVAMNMTGLFCNVLFPEIHYVTPTFSFVKKAKQVWQLTALFCFHYLWRILPSEKLHTMKAFLPFLWGGGKLSRTTCSPADHSAVNAVIVSAICHCTSATVWGDALDVL